MGKYLVILCVLLSTTGCATVGMSILGGATSATVSNVLGGSADRTFTLPEGTVREATLTALGDMGVVLRDPEPGENAAAIYGKAGDRPVEVEFERLGESLTAVRITARRMGFLRDTATANEIVAQTERVLGFSGAAPSALARGAAVQPVSAAASKPQEAPPVYVLHLEELPAAAARRAKPVPAQLQDYVVFTTATERNGRKLVQLNLGYFSSEAEADAARLVAATRFPGARVAVHKGLAPAADPLPADGSAASAGLIKVAHKIQPE